MTFLIINDCEKGVESKSSPGRSFWLSLSKDFQWLGIIFALFYYHIVHLSSKDRESRTLHSAQIFHISYLISNTQEFNSASRYSSCYLTYSQNIKVCIFGGTNRRDLLAFHKAYIM